MDGIIVNNLCKTYIGEKGHIHPVLQNINFQWHPGEFVSLIGESGSGKSTLAKMILGIEKPDKGSVFMDGIELTTLDFKGWKRQRKYLQGVFQDASGTMNPRRSVYANVEEAMINLTEMNREQRRERIQNLMQQTGLATRLLDVPVRQLSGGEQRRFALLKVMAIQPKYLILDEATSGLDLVSAESVIQMLCQFRRETNCSFLFITHDLHSAYQLSDRIIRMQQGRMTLEGINNTKKETML